MECTVVKGTDTEIMSVKQEHHDFRFQVLDVVEISGLAMWTSSNPTYRGVTVVRPRLRGRCLLLLHGRKQML